MIRCVGGALLSLLWLLVRLGLYLPMYIVHTTVECEAGWTRFGDECLQAQDETDLGAQEAADACADLDSTLWWPDSMMEVQFVQSHIWCV